MSIYTYRASVFGKSSTSASLPDLTGFDVEAEDGKIGKIDEASYETDASSLVVDTGFWIFGKKRMIPAGVVDSVDPQEKTVFVRMTKDQIKDAPDYDPDRDHDDKTSYRREVGDYYSPYSHS